MCCARCGEEGSAEVHPLLLLFCTFIKRKDQSIWISHLGLGKSRPALTIAPNIVERKVMSYLAPEMVQRFLNERWRISHSDDGSCLLCLVDYPNLVTDLKIPLYGRFSRHYMFLILKIYWLIDWLIAMLGLRFCARAFSSCGKRGPLFIGVCGPLTIVASLAAERRLQTRRLSSCGSRA